MFVPVPVLIIVGLVILGLTALLLSRRRDGGRDLMRPPASFGATPVALPPAAATEAPAADALVNDVRLLLQGRKIEAIKQVRDRQPGMDLKAAKDWVERVEAGY